jgi:phosphocarrier protein HPr
MGLLMLGAGNGCSIDISAEGVDAAEAIEALNDLVATRFGEDE